MDDEDYLRIEAKLGELAALVGAPEIMDRRCYRRPADRDRTEGEIDEISFSPRERIFAEIEALERHLVLLDRQTYVAAMENINLALSFSATDAGDARAPDTAIIDLDGDGETDGVTIDLADLPNLREVRRMLRELSLGLKES